MLIWQDERIKIANSHKPGSISMSSVTQVEQAMHNIFSQANQLARQSGFVQRRSKLTGEVFLQTLILSWWHDPHASREGMARMAASLGVKVTAQGINDRLTEQAATFLQLILERVIEQVISVDPVAIPLLSRFCGVIILDSTTIMLPDALSTVWRGNGGSTARGTQAAVKLQVSLDLLSGTLSGPFLSDGRSHDNASSLQWKPYPPGTLRIADLSYFKLDLFADYARAGSYFLSRVDVSNALFDQEQHRLDLLTVLQTRGSHLDEPIELGSRHHLAVRLLAMRVPQEVAAARRKKMQQEARDKGQTISPTRLALASWTILVTNVPADMLSLEEALVLLRARWQIELLFKLWKQHGCVDDWCGKKPWAILCEVYAKLIALVFQHWLLLVGCWQTVDRSLVKAAQALRAWVPLLAAVCRGLISFSAAVEQLQYLLASGCRINSRKKRPNTYQFLLGRSLPYQGLT